jgi:formate/nitrite transporter FocA (FNT family)
VPIETLTPELTEGEKEIVEERTALRAAVVHEAIREQGETELRRPVLALTWSGLAAGLSMGFSMISQGLLQSHLPDAPWRPLITNLGYSVGFLVVILGRQQLFTENTLTVILPLLARRDGATLLGVGRLWSIVLIANLMGALAIAWVIGNTSIFTPDVRGAFSMIGAAALSGGPSTIFLRGIFAGWLIALTVWMLPAAEGSRPVIIIAMTYLVGLGGFAHVIAGSVEVLYVVTTSGAVTWIEYFRDFLLPALGGNIVGGVSLVALFNHAQVVTERNS